jgi:hypothetical protein
MAQNAGEAANGTECASQHPCANVGKDTTYREKRKRKKKKKKKETVEKEIRQAKPKPTVSVYAADLPPIPVGGPRAMAVRRALLRLPRLARHGMFLH